MLLVGFVTYRRLSAPPSSPSLCVSESEMPRISQSRSVGGPGFFASPTRVAEGRWAPAGVREKRLGFPSSAPRCHCFPCLSRSAKDFTGAPSLSLCLFGLGVGVLGPSLPYVFLHGCCALGGGQGQLLSVGARLALRSAASFTLLAAACRGSTRCWSRSPREDGGCYTEPPCKMRFRASRVALSLPGGGSSHEPR